MEDIYYIIGTAYAGKSTMVKLLAEKYDGIACEENYHDKLVDERLDKDKFPCLCYTRDLQDWREFIRRTPEEYASWIEGVTKECEILELQILEELKKQGRRIFVDTNISIETLKKISDIDHVLVMLSDQMISVNRFSLFSLSVLLTELDTSYRIFQVKSLFLSPVKALIEKDFLHQTFLDK